MSKKNVFLPKLHFTENTLWNHVSHEYPKFFEGFHHWPFQQWSAHVLLQSWWIAMANFENVFYDGDLCRCRVLAAKCDPIIDHQPSANHVTPSVHSSCLDLERGTRISNNHESHSHCTLEIPKQSNLLSQRSSAVIFFSLLHVGSSLVFIRKGG